MSETNEKNTILENLKYIDLDLENIPDFLKNYQDVDYKPTRAYEQTDFRVYRYINLKDIQILLTPKNRLDTITDKYSKAMPLIEYLNNEEEKNIVNHALFLKMVEKLNKKEIYKIEKEQELAKEKVPFKVKYDTNYLWEIYYSEFTGKYFMLVTTEDQNYNAFFYLLKKQIECYKSGADELIFVPISYLDYTKRYLKKSEISDLEKYIWIFTKDWPKVYEVFDSNNDLTIHIVGKATVYDKISSYYKTELKTKEETLRFYTLVKALFILQTELPHHYKFETQIGEKGELVFEFNNKKIEYNNLPKFIKEEYKKNSKELQKIFVEKEKLDIEVEKLKERELEKNKEYFFREKQVATYLECRKSVFGKIKYFFKNKNTKFVKAKHKNTSIKKIQEQNEVEKSIANSIIEEKEQYTIEDLIKICVELDRINIRIRDSRLDIKALIEKIEIVESKIKNATKFIETIEEHKKSIFEFWKFANKDVALGLNPGKEEIKKVESKKIKRAFDYEEDIEDFGIEADKKQRNMFTKDETDSVYLATTNIINDINKIKNGEEISEDRLNFLKNSLKEEAGLLGSDSFDIFGNIKNDKTKVSILANKRHRESKKDKYKILDLSEHINLSEYIEKIKEEKENIEKAIEKTSALIDMDIYLCSNEKINLNNINKFYINPFDAIQKENADKISLYKIKIKEGMNIIYNTNIIYYDNLNNTLPEGMDVEKAAIFDMSKYKIDVKKQKIFRINGTEENFNFNEKIICVYEYEAKKEVKKENEDIID